MFRETILLRYSADGDSRQSLGTFPGPEYLAPVGDMNVTDALSRQVVRVPDGAGLYVGSSGGFEVQHFQSDGVLDRVIRSSHRNLALTQEHRDAFEASERAGTEAVAQSFSNRVRMPDSGSPPDMGIGHPGSSVLVPAAIKVRR